MRVYAARDYPLKDLARERLLTVVMSTHGDGDPPDDARGFVEHITGKRAPKLDGLRYSVLALGDSSYPKFCETGRQVDERLAALGARRLLPRVECDVDFERLAAPWLDQVVTGARDALGASAGRDRHPSAQRARGAARTTASSHSRPRVAGEPAHHRPRRGSKDVRHLEISLEGSGLRYQPGDALGVWHENPPLVVDAVLGALGLRRRRAGDARRQTRTLREWLAREREITRLTRPFLAAARAALRQRRNSRRCSQPGNEDRLRRTLKDLQLVDVLQRLSRPHGTPRRSSRRCARWRRGSIRSPQRRTPWATRCT